MTEIATINWFGMWGTSVFSENTAIFLYSFFFFSSFFHDFIHVYITGARADSSQEIKF